MKKVGIISYWDSLSNYGQILQGAALQYTLKKLGYSPTTFKYVINNSEDKKSITERIHDTIKDERTFKSRISNRFKSKIKTQNENIDRIKPEEFAKNRKFDEFKAKHLNLSNNEYKNLEDFDNDINNYHAFITGSDQVWHKTGGAERKRIFLLDFLTPDIKRLSYAASFGRDKIINKKEFKLFEDCLKKFDKVGVREDSGVKLCHSLGRLDTELLPDPAILLNKDDWTSFLKLNNKTNKTKKVFCYSLKANDTRIHSIITLFKKIGYEIDYVCSDGIKDTMSNTEPTIEQWVNGINQADFVVTTSFHGTLFALILNTPFLSVGKSNSLDEGSNRRFYSILNQLNMLDHLVNKYDPKSIKKLIDTSVNWSLVNNHFKVQRQNGLTYLNKNLQK